jgi:hypothetical protein
MISPVGLAIMQSLAAVVFITAAIILIHSIWRK